MKKIIFGILGWYGVFAILLAYALVNSKVVSVDDLIYQILNLTGASGIVILALSERDWQPAVLNVIWAIIAILALFRIIIFR